MLSFTCVSHGCWSLKTRPHASISRRKRCFRVPIDIGVCFQSEFSHNLASLAMHAIGAKDQVSFIYASIVADNFGFFLSRLDVRNLLPCQNIGFDFLGKLIVKRLNKLCSMESNRAEAVAEDIVLECISILIMKISCNIRLTFSSYHITSRRS